MNSKQQDNSPLCRLQVMVAEQHAADLIAAINTASHAISVLRSIVEEVAGVCQPFSTESYLPAHLIHDAREVIEQYEREHEAK